LLVVDDDEYDVELLQRSLRRLPCTVDLRRVDNYADLRMALVEFRPDVVISDQRMPDGMTGTQALHTVRHLAPQVPFIFVSGTLDEAARALMRQWGVLDVVSKDQLGRLAPILVHALDLREPTEQ
jgi:CheY-like chemotaxis protein